MRFSMPARVKKPSLVERQLAALREVPADPSVPASRETLLEALDYGGFRDAQIFLDAR